MYRFVMGVSVLLLVTPVWGDIDVCTDPGYCGTDLVFDPGNSIEIDLGGAMPGAWDDPSPKPGSGVYDANMWAVVFKYESVNIPGGVTVSFKNHPSGAPVVWLVQGDIIINGAVVLNGDPGHAGSGATTHAEPGPGGFRGGRGLELQSDASGGFGPGGASSHTGTGSHGTGGSYGWMAAQASQGGTPGPSYGNPVVLPLIGGSGGAGARWNNLSGGGGAGGGAILIATNTSILLNGSVTANGGDGGTGDRKGGGGSGGGIRLIADIVAGTGFLRAVGGFISGGGTSPGSGGRIRVEANDILEFDDAGVPPFTQDFPTDPVNIWPDETFPMITAVSLAGQPISADPKRGLNFPDQEVLMSDGNVVSLVIEAMNVPAVAEMKVRVIRKTGADFTVDAVKQSGDFGFSTWQADFVVPGRISAIQVRVVVP